MLFILVLILFSLIIFNFQKYWIRFKLAFKIPGPWFIPFIGCVQIAAKLKPEEITGVVQNLREKYKRTFRLFLGPNLWVFLHTPQEIKEALNNLTLRRAADFQQLKPILGEGLLLSEEKKWITRRRALTPAFHAKLLQDFTGRIIFHADVLIKNLERTCGKPIEISDMIFHCILDTICETSMGAEINSQSDSNCPYAKAYHQAFHILFQRMVNPLLGFDFIFNRLEASKQLSNSIKIIHDMTGKLIKERRELITQQYNANNENELNEILKDEIGKQKKMAMLDILLNINIDGKYLSDQDIKDEVNTFLFAGVDTTKAAMCFALYNLAKYPIIQKKIYNEISLIKSTLNESTITMEQIKSLNILDQFLKESLRLHTIVPMTGRKTTCEIKIGDIIYPKNISIWINMYGLAHDENFFSNPYEFDLERFSKDSEIINQYTYLPFSAGPHNCIEMVLSARQGFNLVFKKRK
ncbi:probable cytochrome P450 311a1 isoform X2 [Condylostylus longicornis]|uniref:probable cytochrome P450 311a1 isoform X2 n=1 Tax=Condylostylus longicornis TaxID=2530218 RepID=UPI00244E1A42|nr:probable cytochrome P450 311a1 isoform X2 [Condylostylus longicornis]